MRGRLNNDRVLDGDERERSEYGEGILHGSVNELGEAVALDPKVIVLMVHGWGDDLACPVMASVLIADQPAHPTNRSGGPTC